jgi:hypothetical protein
MILLGITIILVGILAINVQESRTFRLIKPQATALGPHDLGVPLPTDTVSATVTGVLENPKYQGQSFNGETWQIAAARATQLAEGSATPNTQSGRLNLTELTASWAAPKNNPANTNHLRISAPFATLTISTSHLLFPQGMRAQGQINQSRIELAANFAQAELTSMTLALSGGVSTTIFTNTNP